MTVFREGRFHLNAEVLKNKSTVSNSLGSLHDYCHLLLETLLDYLALMALS